VLTPASVLDYSRRWLSELEAGNLTSGACSIGMRACSGLVSDEDIGFDLDVVRRLIDA
jgi:hypothetical protein